jgi:putative transposase
MSKQNKCFTYRAYPNEQQQILFAKTIGCERFVWNHMLADRNAHYKTTGESLWNTPAQYKKQFSFLNDVDSLALANVQLDLDSAQKMFFKKKTGAPVFKSKKKDKRSYTTNRVNNNIQLFESDIKLPKMGMVRIKKHREAPVEWKLKSVTFKQVKSGKYFVSVLFEYDKDVTYMRPEKFIGLDYAMDGLYVDSNGYSANMPKYYRQAEDRLAREQRKLSHMVKGSSNWFKQKKRIAILSEHVADQRKDFQDKLSTQIANAYDCVALEDLNMDSMGQALKFGKSVHDNAFGQFKKMLAYKLNDRGKYLVTVDKWYPSSQTCHECGNVWNGTKNLSVREWTCPACGHHHDRDENAACNIRDEGKRILLESFA